MSASLSQPAHDVYKEGLGHIIYDGLSATIQDIRKDPTGGMKEAGQGIRAVGSTFNTLGDGLILMGDPVGGGVFKGAGGALKYGGRSVIQAKKLHDDFAEEGFNPNSVKDHEKDIEKIAKNVEKAGESVAKSRSKTNKEKMNFI